MRSGALNRVPGPERSKAEGKEGKGKKGKRSSGSERDYRIGVNFVNSGTRMTETMVIYTCPLGVQPFG